MTNKHGKEIWEGDILQVPVKDGDKYKVVFANGGFTVINLDSSFAQPASNDYLKVFSDKEEIIGNIYEGVYS